MIQSKGPCSRSFVEPSCAWTDSLRVHLCRIQQVIALQAELTSQLAELQNPGVNSRSSSLWQFNWSLRKGLVGSKGMQVAWANGVAAKILLEFIPCKCLSRATSLRLRKMWAFRSLLPLQPTPCCRIAEATDTWQNSCRFEGARDVHSKLVYAGFFGLLSWEATTFGEVAAVATEAHSVYVRAGRPKISTIVFALPVMLLVSFWSAHVMCGEVSHAEAAAALNKEVPQLEYPLRRQVYGMVRSFEGCWEPQCSERIGRWRRQEDADEEAANGAPCEVNCP